MPNLDTIRYRLVAREILSLNMSLEEAEYALGVYHDQGRADVVMEKYFPDANRLGRDPDLH
jgi:hypothetical protein